MSHVLTPQEERQLRAQAIRGFLEDAETSLGKMQHQIAELKKLLDQVERQLSARLPT